MIEEYEIDDDNMTKLRTHIDTLSSDRSLGSVFGHR